MTRADFPGISLENDFVCKLSLDGTGTVSSRRFMYMKPGEQVGSVTGRGAYTELVSWPISWKALGGGRFKLECTGDFTSTGPGYSVAPRLNLGQYAHMMGNTLILEYSHIPSVVYQEVDSKDPRLNPSQREIDRHLAIWRAKAPEAFANATGLRQALTNVNGRSVVGASKTFCQVAVNARLAQLRVGMTVAEVEMLVGSIGSGMNLNEPGLVSEIERNSDHMRFKFVSGKLTDWEPKAR